MSKFRNTIEKHQLIFKKLHTLENNINKAIEVCSSALLKNNKLLMCGNGGSASDAQHLAAEFVGRFTKDRIPLPAISLNTDTSALTCIANDFSYDEIFERQLKALGLIEDVLIVFSTSGKSQNIINCCKAAKEMKLKVVGFLGKGGGETANYCDIALIIPSENTANIQEAHIFLAHFLCGEVEKRMGLV